MSAWAVPGVKCVCVRSGDIGDGEPENPTPDKQAICVVVARIDDPCGRGQNLIIRGHPNVFQHYGEIGWSISRFRPLVTRTQEQDLAIFLPILTDLPVKVSA